MMGFVGIVQTDDAVQRVCGVFATPTEAISAARAMAARYAGKVACCAIREDIHPPNPEFRIDLLCRLNRHRVIGSYKDTFPCGL